MLTKDLLIRCIQMDETVKSAPTPVRVAAEELRELRRLALLGLERDERAERIGRAVLEQEGDETPRDLRCRAAQAERYGYESYGALLLAVADAMEDEA